MSRGRRSEGTGAAPSVPGPGPRARDGRSVRWEEHRATRRTRIVDAACAVLERLEPGADFHIRDVADEAALGRSVLYRHFADRADLDAAVQRRILDSLLDRLEPEVNLSGSIATIIGRIVGAYVGWAADHPSWHWFAASRSSQGSHDLDAAMGRIGTEVSALVSAAVTALEIPFTEEDERLLDPFVFGIVGQVFGSVRHWLSRPVLEPPADVLAEQLARMIWVQLDTLARDRGATLDPATPLEDILLGSA